MFLPHCHGLLEANSAEATVHRCYSADVKVQYKSRTRQVFPVEQYSHNEVKVVFLKYKRAHFSCGLVEYKILLYPEPLV